MDPSPILNQDDPPSPYDEAKLPPLKPKVEPYSILDTRPINTTDTWMTRPSVLNCPPGLEYLTGIDKLLFIKDQDRKAKTIKHIIKNDLGENVYTAIEEYELCCFICCNITRPFEVKILDQQEREVLHIHRPLRSQSCCFPCCLQSVTVTASGNLCGFIKQSWHPLTPKFKICDLTGKTILIIKGPWYVFKPIQYLGPDFKVYLNDGKTEVGNVSQFLTYMSPENFPNSAHFSVSFPINLDVNLKAVLLAASILIESLYYSVTTKLALRAGEAYHIGSEVGHCLAHCLH